MDFLSQCYQIIQFFIILLLSILPLIQGVSIFTEKLIEATEFEKFDWVITFVSIQEQVHTIELYRKLNATNKLRIMSYNLQATTEIEYSAGYSSKDVVIRVDDEALQKLKDPETAVNVLTTGVIYHFVNPKKEDSGVYQFVISGERVDSKKPFEDIREAEIIVKQPTSPNLVQVTAPGRIGFGLEIPCSLISEQARREYITAVFWRKGPFLASSRLITQWRKFQQTPDYPKNVETEGLPNRLSFKASSSESIFETNLDATLQVIALNREDFDNWWCEVEFNQATEDAVVVYQVSVTPDTAPINNNDTIPTKRDGKTVSFFDNWDIILEPPYLWILIGVAASIFLLVLICCICIYCVFLPNHDRRRRGVAGQPVTYSVAKRISHVSIVPCEICQLNAIECFAMPCGHTYCDECLDNLISTSSVCIFCRKMINKKQRLYNRIEEHDLL